jgi:hypothetical protein
VGPALWVRAWNENPDEGAAWASHTPPDVPAWEPDIGHANDLDRIMAALGGRGPRPPDGGHGLAVGVRRHPVRLPIAALPTIPRLKYSFVVEDAGYTADEVTWASAQTDDHRQGPALIAALRATD